MAVRQLFRFSVLLLLAQMLYRAVTQQCTGGPSAESILGWMLRGHIYSTMLADLPSTCTAACRQDDRCQSINWVIYLQMCEFNNRTKEAKPEDFIPDKDRFYFGRKINRVPLGSIPELPARTCKEIKLSEGEQAVSKKYWFDSIKPGKTILAECDMNTEDIDECTAVDRLCDLNADCINTYGSYYCSCLTGFTGDGELCKDIDECSAADPFCDLNADCINTNGLFYCSCLTGFTGDGVLCIDIDECASESHSCLINTATCTNTDGSYNCTCKPGYEGDGKTNCAIIPECQSYKSLSKDDERRYTHINPHAHVKCDDKLSGWYRFQGVEGTKLVASCVPMNRCHTDYPGWLNGGHPTVADGQVTRQVCFHGNSDCCYWSINIQVRNCGDFYVYYLNGTPPAKRCYLRYCTSD